LITSKSREAGVDPAIFAISRHKNIIF